MEKESFKISYDDPTVQKFLEDLQSETDRGAAILAHTYLEELLTKLLKSKLVEHPDFINYLENRATFMHKLTFCYIT